MNIELEDRLREAYAQLPDGDGNRGDVLARSRHAAVKLRRHRSVGMCAGTVAAALAVGAVAIVPGLSATGRNTSVLPAAGSTPTASRAAQVTESAPATAKHTGFKLPQEGTDKPIAGLSGRLLPHGSQLGPGLAYHGVNTRDYLKTWTTSLADGYLYGVPVSILIGADQTDGAPTPAQTQAAYGIVSSVGDMASTSEPDTSPSFDGVQTSIVRFRTPALARTALAKAHRKEGGLYWIDFGLTKPNVAWPGVSGVTGSHGVYQLPSNTGPRPIVVAYQVVGAYIVSANATTAHLATKAVTDTVGNLKTARLLP